MLYSQPGEMEKKEIKPKQAKSNSTRNLDQSNNISIDSTIKKHKDKENQKIAATQEDKLAEIGTMMRNILSRLDNLELGTKKDKHKQVGALVVPQQIREAPLDQYDHVQHPTPNFQLKS
ncbi:29857_t:CDS:2 [Gigaspora margarita]|uniref:29857_t:CDS:1 n=1 Tax=Gigaspora margarita TaxID=4874 RepID=A0ABN7UCW9_GIGMA|nr:29857_t:CDS:2 [Gigaspora margarita]